jgi:hypothetical protein
VSVIFTAALGLLWAFFSLFDKGNPAAPGVDYIVSAIFICTSLILGAIIERRRAA